MQCFLPSKILSNLYQGKRIISDLDTEKQTLMNICYMVRIRIFCCRCRALLPACVLAVDICAPRQRLI